MALFQTVVVVVFFDKFTINYLIVREYIALLFLYRVILIDMIHLFNLIYSFT